MTISPLAIRALASLALSAAALAHAAGFDVADTHGKRYRLEALKGRWVVVNFWATWCVPCIQEIPEISAFARAHPGVVVLGIAIDSEDPARVKRFAAKLGLSYPLVLSNDAVERDLGRPAALPTTKIYDPSGRLVYDRPGRIDRKALEAITGARAKSSAMESA